MRSNDKNALQYYPQCFARQLKHFPAFLTTLIIKPASHQRRNQKRKVDTHAQEKGKFVFLVFVLRLRLRFVASHQKISDTSARQVQGKQNFPFSRACTCDYVASVKQAQSSFAHRASSTPPPPISFPEPTFLLASAKKRS